MPAAPGMHHIAYAFSGLPPPGACITLWWWLRSPPSCLRVGLPRVPAHLVATRLHLPAGDALLLVALPTTVAVRRHLPYILTHRRTLTYRLLPLAFGGRCCSYRAFGCLLCVRTRNALLTCISNVVRIGAYCARQLAFTSVNIPQHTRTFVVVPPTTYHTSLCLPPPAPPPHRTCYCGTWTWCRRALLTYPDAHEPCSLPRTCSIRVPHYARRRGARLTKQTK